MGIADVVRRALSELMPLLERKANIVIELSPGAVEVPMMKLYFGTERAAKVIAD